MAKKNKRNIEIDVKLSEHDFEVLGIVMECGLELLEADDASDEIMNRFPVLSASFLYHVSMKTDFSPSEFALAAYCLELAVDAIAGNIAVEKETHSLLSSNMFVIKKLSDRFSKGLEQLPKR